MITHFGFRFALGLHVLLLGIVLLLTSGNRQRSNLWGPLFRLGDAFHHGRVHDRPQAKVYLVKGWLAVVAALMVLLVGVRPSL